MAQKEAGQGPIHHVPHGQIKQRDHEDEGDDQPEFHLLDLRLGLLHRALLGRAAPFGLGQVGAIPPLLHRLDDLLGAQGLFIVIHRHIVAQQVDGHLRHPLQLAHALFHMGRAGCAGHASDIEFGFHKQSLLSECREGPTARLV